MRIEYVKPVKEQKLASESLHRSAGQAATLQIDENFGRGGRGVEPLYRFMKVRLDNGEMIPWESLGLVRNS
ncbi:hypothetical protein K0M31_016977 [Melipona bicolor]|uniref:Uncharacterized protein n=1 Tax=Melipona bicolor TaxID=60889 RepID=A0AA40FDY2_9HYME|nr:hypothetical protein K0M31_016977 [Melipona bicolor]